ncbi:hypothetical protein H7347_07130 [Corynebacterium sp. zg-331]|uniref:hypothetical protein n=1 Tax=unclassified Corynebacterium TaxID=2624378 RepID=UPI00128E7E98|nr:MULTISPECIES: hypothetical protein [unclassified Corynebacterium]MBC3186345.1 hypothetical protein [Corynebacterium sp. zg-331]MPV52832.1 hypothetical protein [Corynebacterium sp. zg331]
MPLPVLAYALGGAQVFGYWPSFNAQAWNVITLGGMLLALGAAWSVAGARVEYLRSCSRSGVRFFFLLMLPVLMGGYLFLGASLGILLWKLMAVTPGGEPWWWLAGYYLLWPPAAGAAGMAMGVVLHGKKILAPVAAFFFAALLVLAGKYHHAFSPLPIVVPPAEGLGDRVDLSLSVGHGIASVFSLMVFLWLCLLFLLVGRKGRVAVSSLCAALLILLAVLVPGYDLVPRALPQRLSCTDEYRGSRVCGWEESRVYIEALNGKWPEYVDFLRGAGVRVPEGITTTHSLRDFPRADGNPTLDSIRHQAAMLSTVASSYLRDQMRGCVDYDPSFYETIGFEIGLVAKRILFPGAPRYVSFSTHDGRISDWMGDRTDADALAREIKPYVMELEKCADPNTAVGPW